MRGIRRQRTLHDKYAPPGRHVHRPGARLFEPQAPFFETDKLVMPQNDMVQRLDVEHFAGMPQLLRGTDIFG